VISETRGRAVRPDVFEDAVPYAKSRVEMPVQDVALPRWYNIAVSKTREMSKRGADITF